MGGIFGLFSSCSSRPWYPTRRLFLQINLGLLRNGSWGKKIALLAKDFRTTDAKVPVCIAPTPLGLHCTHIDSKSIPSNVMCSSSTAIMSSGSIATQGAGGARVFTARLCQLFSTEHHKTRKSPRACNQQNHNCEKFVRLSAWTTLCVADIPKLEKM